MAPRGLRVRGVLWRRGGSCTTPGSSHRRRAAHSTTPAFPQSTWSTPTRLASNTRPRQNPGSSDRVVAAAAAGLCAAAVATATGEASTSRAEEEPKADSSDAWAPPAFAPFALPSFAGDVCVVTGGSTGIGRATCEALADAGGTVYSLDVVEPPAPTRAANTTAGGFLEKKTPDAQKPYSTPLGLVLKKSKTGGSLTHVTVDVSDVQGVKRAIDAIADAHEGRVDVLVSNAGVWTGGKMQQVTEAQYERVMAINVKGCFFSVQAVLPHMRARKTGAVVIVGSDQSLVGKPEQNLYGMSKAAIAQLAKSCAAEYAPEGIRFNVVCPGTIDTPLMHGAVREFAAKNEADPQALYTWLETAQPFPRLGQPEEVAALIACIAKIPFVVGSVVSIDGGYTCQ